ncbi:hypothetical protein [Nonomuraea sp. NPDC050643]|uniref:hypothetical protein n=1 Tax=Nonomuraea sp. NPDC050643 TaxID=3155660 RepID=UPI0033D7BD44
MGLGYSSKDADEAIAAVDRAASRSSPASWTSARSRSPKATRASMSRSSHCTMPGSYTMSCTFTASSGSRASIVRPWSPLAAARWAAALQACASEATAAGLAPLLDRAASTCDSASAQSPRAAGTSAAREWQTGDSQRWSASSATDAAVSVCRQASSQRPARYSACPSMAMDSMRKGTERSPHAATAADRSASPPARSSLQVRSSPRPSSASSSSIEAADGAGRSLVAASAASISPEMPSPMIWV